MRRRAEVSLADLLHIVRALAPDESALRAIAAALDIRLVEGRERVSFGGGAPSVAYVPPSGPMQEAAAPPASAEAIDDGTSLQSLDEEVPEFTVVWDAKARVFSGPPGSLGDLPDLEAVHRPAGAIDRAVSDEAQLLPQHQERTLVAAACSQHISHGEIDVECLVEHVASGGSITAIPQRGVWTTRRGCQLLVDDGEAMSPFEDDCRHLEAVLTRVVGADRVQLLRFNGCPLGDDGVGAGPIWDWTAYVPPSSGRPVIVLSDVTAGNHLVRRTTPSEPWEQFAHIVGRAGCPIVALVPYPSSLWPRSLRRFMTFVHWDRDLDVRQVTAAVLRAASVSVGAPW